MNKKNNKSKTLKSLYRQAHKFRDNPEQLRKVELKIKTLENTKVK